MDIFYFLLKDCLTSESLEHKLASMKCYLIFAFHCINLNNTPYFIFSTDSQGFSSQCPDEKSVLPIRWASIR